MEMRNALRPSPRLCRRPENGASGPPPLGRAGKGIFVIGVPAALGALGDDYLREALFPQF